MTTVLMMMVKVTTMMMVMIVTMMIVIIMSMQVLIVIMMILLLYSLPGSFLPPSYFAGPLMDRKSEKSSGSIRGTGLFDARIPQGAVSIEADRRLAVPLKRDLRRRESESPLETSFCLIAPHGSYNGSQRE